MTPFRVSTALFSGRRFSSLRELSFQRDNVLRGLQDRVRVERNAVDATRYQEARELGVIAWGLLPYDHRRAHAG
jgi:hypothetical protein